mgnify:CR=1 FL=1
MKPSEFLRLPRAERHDLLKAACTPEVVAYYDRVAARDWNEETNDGKGWATHEQTCLYCGSRDVHVAPADVDPRTLECGNCGLRELDPLTTN